MKNFDYYLEKGDVCAFSLMTGEVSGDEIMRKLASEDNDIPVDEKDYWEFYHYNVIKKWKSLLNY